jgi:hypothetical protein
MQRNHPRSDECSPAHLLPSPEDEKYSTDLQEHKANNRFLPFLNLAVDMRVLLFGVVCCSTEGIGFSLREVVFRFLATKRISLC